ncbi:MAG: hypothetical protein AB1529_07830 [Candidatus Micrarchaeota archaeon]
MMRHTHRTSGWAALAASKKFGRYKGESGGPVREARKDEVLDRLIALWDVREKELAGRIQQIRHSADDVERLSVALGALEGEPDFYDRAGRLLRALVIHGKDSEFRIHTKRLRDVEGVWKLRNRIINGEFWKEEAHYSIDRNPWRGITG